MTIPGNVNELLLRTAAAAGGYSIDRSLRFNAVDGASLTRTPGSAGNRKTWTWSAWVKRSTVNSANYNFLFGAIDASATNYTHLLWPPNDDSLSVWDNQSGIPVLRTTQVFRDPSAWFHIVWALDTTQATASARMKLYVNGSEITSFATDSRASITQNLDLAINRQSWPHAIGGQQPYAARYFDGYLADIYFIDGTALTPSSFGETDATTGVWVPKAPTGLTYGTNGFHLDFADNSSAAALGYDAAGSNDWTVNNIQAAASGTNYTLGTTLANGSLEGWFAGSLTTGSGYIRPQTLASFTNLPAATTSLRIYAWAQNANQGNFVVNGNSTSISTGTTNNYAWLNLSSLCPITLTSFRTSAGSINDGFFVRAIEVNGTILVDGVAPSQIDSLRDSPTNGTASTGGDAGGVTVGNYATWNPLDMYSGMTLANGNLEATGVGTTWRSVKSTLAIPGSGKWYFEMSPTHTDGVHGVGTAKEVNSNYCGATTEGWGFQSGGYYNSTYTAGASYSANDVLMVAIDRGAQKLWFGVNGTWVGSGNPGSGTNATFSNLPASDPLFPMASPNSSTKKVTLNAGQRAFSYAAPTGFKGLCTANLPATTIVKPSTVFDVKLYTGTGSTQSITGLGFSPDFVWIKRRTVASNHCLFDVVRGATKRLVTDGTDAEATVSTALTSFDSSGFTVGSDSDVNGSTYPIVSWAWDAGTSNATNTSGTITSTVRANISAGISIVSYTGNGTSAQTVGHSLGVAPEFLIVKCRSHANDWIIYHKAMGDKYISFDAYAANDAPATIWNDTAPTSTVFSIGTSSALNTATRTYVAYAWAPVAGYSAFGSYTGNGSSTDGPFVATSMRPRLIMLKRTDTTSNWTIIDTARAGYNVDNDPLYPNLSNAEGTTDLADILSNGFKLRSTDASVNASGGTYIYCAWAESPFQYARAR
jgi:hypothetical protein